MEKLSPNKSEDSLISDSSDVANLSSKISKGVESIESLTSMVDLAAKLFSDRPEYAEQLLIDFYQESYLSLQASLLSPVYMNDYRDPLTNDGQLNLHAAISRADELSKLVRNKLQNEYLLNNSFTNPTGGTIRPQDPWGSGEYEASRDNGARLHAGVDYLGETNAAVFAGIGGALEVVSDGVRITGRVNGILYTVRQLHINTTIAAGKVVSGQQVATGLDLTGKYPGIQNHCHIEIYEQPGNNRLDPTSFFGS